MRCVQRIVAERRNQRGSFGQTCREPPFKQGAPDHVCQPVCNQLNCSAPREIDLEALAVIARGMIRNLHECCAGEAYQPEQAIYAIAAILD
jgi:hypothetical protein